MQCFLASAGCCIALDILLSQGSFHVCGVSVECGCDYDANVAVNLIFQTSRAIVANELCALHHIESQSAKIKGECAAGARAFQ